jgi:hypothetical protein
MEKPRTKLFLDTEFTGLHQHTTLISLALVSETGEEFYAEFTDYDRAQVTPWIEEHVLKNLPRFDGNVARRGPDLKTLLIKDTSAVVADRLTQWLQKLGPLEIWSDVLAYDWVLFCQLFGGAQALPSNISYIPLDISTAFRVMGLNPDLPRIALALEGKSVEEQDEILEDLKQPGAALHNALFDARIQLACYRTLQRAIKASREKGEVLKLDL